MTGLTYKSSGEDSRLVSDSYLNVPQESRSRNVSPYTSNIEQTEPSSQKSIPTIRQRPEHLTYVYQKPLTTIRESPSLEELAACGWVDTECKTKDTAVKEWDSEANVSTNGNYDYNRQ